MPTLSHMFFMSAWLYCYIATMETMPNEIMNEIAAYLPTSDLRQFRRASRRCAAIGLPGIARQLRLLNTTACLQNFCQFLLTIPTVYTRTLTIYHSKWPIFANDEWQTHPLLLYERGPHSGLSPPGVLTSSPLREYREFLAREDRRRYGSDLQIIVKILRTFPNLHNVTIETLQPWARVAGPYARKSPALNKAMNHMVRCVVNLLHHRPSVNTLEIRGKIPQAVLKKCPIPTTITTLRITSLVGGPLSHAPTPLSIPSHTNLSVLEVNCPAHPRQVFLLIELPKLRFLSLQGRR
ncbi:hypothetical protein F5Y17DRAFT_157093 [Xylariaceae sp. FL0594]|nr:hypothetical protein F5Y17DRAFT_157093 [Xylariaceae sp. FL0594]